MKKTFVILVSMMLLFTTFAFADEPPAVTDSFRFETFSDAVVSMEEGDAFTVSDGTAVAVLIRDGRCFRVVSSFDEQSKELYTVYYEDGNFTNDEYQALYEYMKTLPVQYTEELAVVPLTQDEMDAIAGKTIEEAMSEPWNLSMCNYPQITESDKDIVFPMEKGFCEYELVINESPEVYQERRARDHYDPVTIMSLRNYLDLTVKCVRYTGISSFNALNLSYLADGTIKYDIEPIPEGYNYDLMAEIADYLADIWAGGEPDQETKDAMISKLTAEHPESAEMIRQIVESFH